VPDNSFDARADLEVGGRSYEIYRLHALQSKFDVARLPFSLKILLENLLRTEDGVSVRRTDIEALAGWDHKAEPSKEIAFSPARVVMQDFTGVPAIVDLAAMRDAMADLGGDPAKINPLVPAELVIDHSVQVDAFGTRDAFRINAEKEFERNQERYAFLRWGQTAFEGFVVVPPDTGIVHQVNLEYLATVITDVPDPAAGDRRIAYPDTLVGTDSHTTMVNGLGVLGWGVGGIEAEAAMLGESISMLVPQVVELDLSSVEPSLAGPRRPQDRIPLARAKESFQEALGTFGVDYGTPVDAAVAESFPASDAPAHADPGAGVPEGEQTVEAAPVAVAPLPVPGIPCELDGEIVHLTHGAVVIAAITSCTNTSNPSVMVAAGLLAKKAVERGLDRKPWVKSSLAPGSKVVSEYFERAGLTPYLEALGFHTVGYGCTTCIGNSGPLPEPVSQAIAEGDLVACAVLSGNRNFEARVHPEVKANYLASPPLVVAYALAGRMDVDLVTEPLGNDPNGDPVYLSDLWPSPQEVRETVEGAIGREMFERTYADVYTGDPEWRELPVPEGSVFAWDEASTYVRRPPYFDGMSPEAGTVDDVHDARCLVSLGDSVTTDHISPAGSIKPESPAGRYLVEHGVERKEFNSDGSRRGNHEVMVRGTFANVRLRNLLVPESEGTWTVHVPSGEETTIFEAAQRYLADGVPTIVLAGKEYGSGSSRDWAAKGPKLLGVRAVLAESYERIHRSNLLMMGILPLQYLPGESRESLGLTGREAFSVTGVAGGEAREVTVRADEKEFRAILRLDTPRERDYVRHGGILPYVLRKLAAG
jgi:aconitate hydratase